MGTAPCARITTEISSQKRRIRTKRRKPGPDGVGNLLTHADEENKKTSYTYDKENRQISVLFAGERTTNLYDKMGNLVSVTRPEGNCRIMAHDPFNRLTSVVDDPAGPIGSMEALGRSWGRP